MKPEHLIRHYLPTCLLFVSDVKIKGLSSNDSNVVFCACL